MRLRSWARRQLALFRTHQIDGFLFVHRSAVSWTIVGSVFFLIVCFLFTLAGFAWKPDPFAPVTLFDEATVLLALGTLALAFAALVQAVSGVETMNARYKPNFELAWESSSAPNAIPTWLKPGRNLVFRNLGPGEARMVKVQLYVYGSAQDADAHFAGRQSSGASLTVQIKIFPTIKIDSAGIKLVPEKVNPPPNQSEAIVEIVGRGVFDQTSPIRMYRLRGVWEHARAPDLSSYDKVAPIPTLIWQVLNWRTWQPWQLEDVPSPEVSAIASTPPSK